MNIVIMLCLVILGWSAGQNLSWWIGTPLICFGLYFFEIGGKRFANFRFRQESLFTLAGLFSILVVTVGNIFSL